MSQMSNESGSVRITDLGRDNPTSFEQSMTVTVLLVISNIRSRGGVRYDLIVLPWNKRLTPLDRLDARHMGICEPCFRHPTSHFGSRQQSASPSLLIKKRGSRPFLISQFGRVKGRPQYR